MRIIRLIAALVLSAQLQTSFASEQVTVDLQQAADLAGNKQLAILVLFSSEDCENCDIARDDFIRLMQKSGDYDDKLLFHIIEMDSGDKLRDFNGQLVYAESIADRYSLELTPTVVLLDGRGQLLASKLSGMSSVDLYGGLLDEAIDKAVAGLRQPNK